MEAIESLENKKNAQYTLIFLRGRKEGSHIEISETVEACDAEQAVNIAFSIAKKAGWHIEKVERKDSREK